MLEVQNNLMWLPTVTNVPALLALRVTTRVSTRRAGEPVVLQEADLAVSELELEAWQLWAPQLGVLHGATQVLKSGIPTGTPAL
jgi:hypothetical protein